MQATNVSHIYTLKYSSIDTSKGIKKQVKLILIFLFNSIYKTLPFEIIQYQNFNDIFNIPFSGTVIEICCVFCTHFPSPLKLATFQVLNGQM